MFRQFLHLWELFYSNEICIPGYYGSFVDEDGDNPEATFELGNKFKEINRHRVICFDSQVGIVGNQKGYVTAYVPKIMAEPLSQELNRYSGIVAFYSEKQDNDSIINEGLYVTYDNSEEEKDRRTLGKPFTQVGRIDFSSMEFIQEWLSKSMRKVISEWNYYQLTIVAPCFDSPSEYII